MFLSFLLPRCSKLFEPVPTSRGLLGEENEALLHLAAKASMFFMILATLQAPIWSPWAVLWAPFLLQGSFNHMNGGAGSCDLTLWRRM